MEIEVPCQKCMECKASRFLAQNFRSEKEGQSWLTASYMATLTIAPAHIEYNYMPSFVSREQYNEMKEKNPQVITKLIKGKRASLNKKDASAFIKRLRTIQDRIIQEAIETGFIPSKYTNLRTLIQYNRMETPEETKKRGGKRPIKLNSIRNLIAGEYGAQFERPHYHVILANFIPEILDENPDLWPYGKVKFEQSKNSNGALAYSVKYLNKPSIIPKYEGDNRIKEFKITSEGWGKSYLTDNVREWHNCPVAIVTDDIRLYCNAPSKKGAPKKVPMDRWYKEKIFDSERRELIQAKQKKLLTDKKIDEHEEYLKRETTLEGREMNRNLKVAMAAKLAKWKNPEKKSKDNQ